MFQLSTSSNLHYLLIWTTILLYELASGGPQIARFKVDEEYSLHTTIGNISSFLLPQPKITVDSPFFKVTPSGLVQLARRIDLEALCTEQFLCCEREKPCELISNVVIEGGNSREIASLELRVEVADVNDHRPHFPPGSENGQTVKISELAEVGSLIDLIPALDSDISRENQVTRYVIHGAELHRTFELETAEPPNVRLRLLKPLDYERIKNYSGILEACDPRNCVQQNLTVQVMDANDNKPMFLKKSYEVTVPENFSVGQTVLTLEAVDNDSPPNAQMDFRFNGEVDPNLKQTFRIESNTGRIILQSRLAAHRRLEYKFSVGVAEVAPGQATRGTLAPSSSYADVLINVEDLNDFSPSIKMISPAEGQTLSVPENSPPTRVCVLHVTDNDSGNNGRVECRLVSRGSSEAFTLSKIDSHYTLSTIRPIDAEVESRLTVTIACTDFGSPPRSSTRDLVVEIGDLNEFPPELKKTNYHANVYENSKAGIEVAHILAEDRDQSAKLFYELSGEGKQYFAIDHATGVITTLGDSGMLADPSRSSSNLDREKTEKIHFQVCVSDGPPQTNCGIKVEQNGGTGKDKSSRIFTATATVFVTVLDENDNRPHFISKGPFSIAENQPRFTQVSGRLGAIDPDEGDNGHVQYSLRQTWTSADGEPRPDLFQVDAEGGIRTMEMLDREKTNAYTLELMACDSAPHNPLCTSLNATVTVVDENDNKPEWHYPHEQDKEVNITADLPPGHVIARVLALDRDAGENGRVVYSLIDPHKRTVFQVDNVTGEVSVSRGNRDDPSSGADTDGNRVEKSSPLLPGVYRLRLRASDMGHPPLATETWLQVNVFGSDALSSTGLNFMIIVIMIAVTGLISICLVIAIICVRRRSNSLRWGRPRHESAINGVRRGRSAGDGAEGANFSLKHEYGFPVDSTGYMMGVSPTPSDLDALKLGYQTSGVPYLGATNGGPDAHMVGWAGIGHPSGVCYSAVASDDGLGFLADHSIDPSTIVPSIPNDGGTLRLPVYASFNRLTPTMSSDKVTLVARSVVGSQPAMYDVSSACLSFASPTPVAESAILSGTCLQSFGDQNKATEPGLDTDDSQMPEYGLSHNAHSSYAYDGSYATTRQNITPLSSTAPVNGGCYHNQARRFGVGPHCELDVESADSGRGPSEDDPGQIGGQMLHFYPTFHLTQQQQQQHHPSVSMNGVVDNDPSMKSNGNTLTAADSEQTNGWNTTERHRLKC
ncbi:unnamed protein product [Calicophoron daubneyi]|uniref:Cadherin domain-containing protein n=1 Tax=Calicophoron daubneyi TaxID=300641 RepID=A0AAV2TDN3_CALDB